MDNVVKQQRNQIFWWSFFDFANSIVIINIGLYFSQWLVVEKGVSEFWFNFMDVLATILLLLTIPAIGIISDAINKRVLFLRLTSIPIAIFTFLIGFSGLMFKGISPIIISLFSFLMVLYFYQLSLIFYHAMLADLAKRGKYGIISGVGLAAGWIGSIIGLIIILPFVKGYIPFFQPSGRIQAFIPSAIIFTFFMTLSLVFLKEPKDSTTSSGLNKISIKQSYIKLFNDIKELRNKPIILYFLIAYWLFIDAILTIQDNFPLYLEIVLKIPDTQKVFLGALLLIMAAIGALVIGRMGDKIGHEKSLKYIIIGWVIVLILLLQVSVLWQLAIVVSLIGILFGGTWTITRALYISIIPATQRSEYFGFYASTERFASVIGPLVWSGFVVGLRAFGPLRYKVAIISMIFLIVLSLIFLKKVKILYSKQ